MKWSNLKLNKCPDCGKTFGSASWANRPGYLVCQGCGFTIKETKFSKIVNSMVTAKIEEELDAKYKNNELF